MDPEERRMLEKLLQISEQTNRIVRRMRHEVILGRLIHVIYWIIIIGVAYAIYYYAKPLLGNLDSISNIVGR